MTAGPASAATPADEPAALVRRLADPSFRVRERASLQLVHLGKRAEPALRAGMADPDAEVSGRCRRLLPRALNFDRDVRLAAFLKDADDKLDPPLAGWKRFRQSFGGDAASRQQFADLHRIDGPLLDALEASPKDAARLFRIRCDQLQQRMHVRGIPQPVSANETLLLLFAATEPQFEPEPQSLNTICGYFQYVGREEAKALAARPATRKLLVAMVSRRDDPAVTYSAVQLAVQLELKELLPLAVRLVRDKTKTGWVRAQAVILVGKLGERKHVAELEPLFADTAVAGTWFVNNERIEAHLGDVALAISLHLTGQTLKDYGFAFARIFEQKDLFTYAPNCLGFSKREQREAALKQWRDWQAKQKK